MSLQLSSNSSNSTGLLSSLIDRVPPEILIQVFAYSAQTLGDDLLPLTLGVVSRYWRDVAYSSPCVWQHMFLDDHRSPRALQLQARLWLQHSVPLPLHVHVNLASVDMLLPLLSPLLSHLIRWRRCTITGVLDHETDMADLVGGSVSVRFRQLQVLVKDLSSMDAGAAHPDVDDSTSDAPLFRSFPSKPILGQQAVSMRVAVRTLPSPHLMSALKITALTITEKSIEAAIEPTLMLQFLTCTPMLEKFYFHSCSHQPGSLQASPPVVDLPCLHVLLLRSSCAARLLLSHIHAPALRELYLEYTNIDFTPPHDPYADAADDGDSDDEAHDYSRSPWSDRAVGMGLRSFVRRCNPPLEVLEMDYADMRTKDFCWCFNRLDRLREFRIIGSDMSNTVIGLLVPYRVYAVPKCGLQDGVWDESWSVRLPLLSYLELWNCQRLAGDAVVAALRTRAQFTDNTADQKIVPFVDVVIADCPDFLIHHAVDLSQTLGSRVRMS